MNLPSNSKLLFIGDSITDAERDRNNESLGNGYVSQIYAWLGATCPELNIRILNKGIGGNTVRDLAGRWQADVLDIAPETLCIMIGINDVWRQFDCPLRPEMAVGPEEYRKTLTELVDAAGPVIQTIHLATPFFIEPLKSDAMRSRMDEYGDIVREIAKDYDIRLIDTQAAFGPILEHFHSSALAWDRVHPNSMGHMIIARAFLKSFGCI